jgi:hypothetical protein
MPDIAQAAAQCVYPKIGCPARVRAYARESPPRATPIAHA